MSDLGPNVWGNFPTSTGTPISDLQAALSTMEDTVRAWPAKIFTNLAEKWQARIDGELSLISAAQQALPASDIFPTKYGRAAYDAATNGYQALLNDLDLSPDTIQGASGDGGLPPWLQTILGPILDALKPILSTLGIGIEIVGIGLAVILGVFIFQKVSKVLG